MADWPEVVIESIRKLYPRHTAKPKEQERIREALDRITSGEIDGNPRSQEQAIAYLRERVFESSKALRMREKRFIPHLTTFLHQSRYIAQRGEDKPFPSNLSEAVCVLREYPTVIGGVWGGKEVEAHMPVLQVIADILREMEIAHGGRPLVYLLDRVSRFSAAVSKWPASERQFVPGPLKFFRERRFEQDERHWQRSTASGYAAEREQLARLA